MFITECSLLIQFQQGRLQGGIHYCTVKSVNMRIDQLVYDQTWP